MANNLSPDKKTFISCSKKQEGAVTIPDGVEAIAAKAFYLREKVSAIHIPPSLRRIGECAFFGCTSLSDFQIPDGVEKIERFTFCGAGLSVVFVPLSVKSIGEGAFADTTTLSRAYVPAKCRIGSASFSTCTEIIKYQRPTLEQRCMMKCRFSYENPGSQLSNAAAEKAYVLMDDNKKKSIESDGAAFDIWLADDANPHAVRLRRYMAEQIANPGKEISVSGDGPIIIDY